MSLRLSLRRRIRVWAMLGLGGVATLASIVRMIIVIRMRNVTDQTLEFVRFNLLGTAEVTIGLICACLPALNIVHTRWQQLRRGPASEGSGGASGDGASAGATPPKGTRLRTLKFLHGSRLRTAPPLSTAAVVTTTETVTTDASRLDGKRAASACGDACPRPCTHVVEGVSAV